MSTHDKDCPCNAYACQLRRKGVTVSSAATPTRGSVRKASKARTSP